MSEQPMNEMNDKVKELLGADMMEYLVKDLKSKKAIEVLFENAVIK